MTAARPKKSQAVLLPVTHIRVVVAAPHNIRDAISVLHAQAQMNTT